MNGELVTALKQIEKERKIPLGMLQEAVESALTSSYRKTFETGTNVRVIIDWNGGGEIKVVSRMTVVTRRKDQETEIPIAQTRKKFQSGKIISILDPETETPVSEGINWDNDEELLGKAVEVVIEENPKKFGRIAAQTTKQVIIQKIREAERDIIFDEYIQKEGDIITVTVQRLERPNWIVDMGKAEGIIPPHEQVPTEHYRRGEKIKVYVVKVEKTAKGPQVILSRTHPGLIRRLFEMEVPEIGQGLVEIHNVSREPGSRSKVSVRALESNVDPLGACVGPRGSRVQMVVDELRGEKVDIINFTDDPFTFVSNSLSPSKVLTVTLNPEDKSALVIVPDNQFSLAIGKEGQNARLAAKLTNWKIDIKSESQAKDLEEQMKKDEEERKRREVERKKQELEEKKLKAEEEEHRKKVEAELRLQQEEEDRKRLEEEERRKKEEAERKRLEEEERRKKEEEKRHKARQSDGWDPILPPPKKDVKKEKEIEEYLKHIPKDIPVEEYVAMAFRNNSADDETLYRGYQEPAKSRERPREEDKDSRSPGKKKKKKKVRRANEYEEW